MASSRGILNIQSLNELTSENALRLSPHIFFSIETPYEHTSIPNALFLILPPNDPTAALRVGLARPRR